MLNSGTYKKAYYDVFDIPAIANRKFQYRDDLAITFQNSSMPVIEHHLSEYIKTLNDYIVKWKLVP